MKSLLYHFLNIESLLNYHFFDTPAYMYSVEEKKDIVIVSLLISKFKEK